MKNTAGFRERDWSLFVTFYPFTALTFCIILLLYADMSMTLILLRHIGSLKCFGFQPKQMYRDDLTSLFKALEQLNAYHGQQNPANMAAQQNMAQQNATQGAVQNGFQSAPLPNNPAPAANAQQIAQGFMAENEKKKENMVIIGFVMSIVGLLLSCFDFTYGAILLVLEYYFAIQELKTKKKGLAIATIVLASVSIVFLMFALALSILPA